MKTNFKLFSLLILMSMFGMNAFGQTYDCKAQNKNFRKDKNKWIVQDADRPFSQSDINDFNGLFYYPIDCNYVIAGTLVLADAGSVVDVGTTDGGSVQLINYGTVSITIDEKTYNLSVYKNKGLPEFGDKTDAIFIPIKDETSGPKPKTTYENGRYLIIEPPASGDQVILDFNMAVNPFENYNGNFPSLVVPVSNVLMTPILTGERKYEDRSN